ncbi:MAG TPA: hemerythrin domain-containing protein [Nocardioidaceae bacterium]|nr:hemerythrin domain-containing protein [Nocardioidaceae bacterium]
MNGILAKALEREHREIDTGIAAFTSRRAADEVETEPLIAAIAALRRHIYLEEQFLFPPLRAAGMMPPVFVMLREHGEMWKVLDTLEGALREDPGADTVVSLCADLVPLLEAHNAKEEAILYAQADAVLSDQASAELQAFLASGRMPEGWVCERARS